MFITLIGPREVVATCHAGARGNARFGAGSRRQEQEFRLEPLLGFPQEKQSRINSLELSSLNNFGLGL